MTADEFRHLALGLDDATEGAHMGHPDFRANGRIFATLHTGDKTGMVKLMPDEQQEFMRTHQAMFEPSPGAWGRQGCTTVILKEADKATIRAAMNLAWQHVMEMAPPKKRAAKAKVSKAVKMPKAAKAVKSAKVVKVANAPTPAKGPAPGKTASAANAANVARLGTRAVALREAAARMRKNR